jgi:hypothetical protein
MEKYRLVQEQRVETEVPGLLVGDPLPQTESSTLPPVVGGDNTGNSPARRSTAPPSSRSKPLDTTNTTSSSSSSIGEFPEVRITQQGKPRNYISYAMGLLVRTLRLVKTYRIDVTP